MKRYLEAAEAWEAGRFQNKSLIIQQFSFGVNEIYGQYTKG